MSNTLNQKKNIGDRSDRDRRNYSSNRRTQGNSNGNALGNGHLIDGINLGDSEGDTSDSDADHVISATDLMMSMLQVESDGSDVASSTDVIPNNTKRRMKSIARRQKDLTVFDAILGARRSAKRVSSQEKSFTQRRNKAIEDFSGPKAHVTATNKDQKKILFKDNTRLLQTIKVLLIAIMPVNCGFSILLIECEDDFHPRTNVSFGQ